PPVVGPPRVGRRELAALVGVRARPDQPLGAGLEQRAHGTVEAPPGERLRLTPARPEAGTPKQPLSLRHPEVTPVGGHSHDQYVGFGVRLANPPFVASTKRALPRSLPKHQLDRSLSKD